MIWYKVEKKKPLAYMTGAWDGKKSDKVLVCTRSGRYYIAEMYEGILDGSEFCDSMMIEILKFKTCPIGRKLIAVLMLVTLSRLT